MKTLEISACLVLSGTLLIAGGCQQANVSPNVVPVTITGCQAKPDPVTVNNGDSVAWTVTGSWFTTTSYIVNFPGSNPPTNTPFLVKSSVSDLPHKMQKDAACTSANLVACDYKYNLTKDTSTQPCADPKVHIIPGT